MNPPLQKKFSPKQSIREWFAASRLAIPILIASLVGIGTALVGVGFIKLIHFMEDVFFNKGGEFLASYGRWWLILIPAAGGLLVGPIVTFLAPEAKGHGVPEVLKAIVVRGGKIRPIVAIAKAVASSIAIGTGASVGREGPIVQVGSAMGSATGQALKLSETRTKNLVACGAAAGIACVFNAPIAGVMFSLEVILKDFGARTLSTVVVAAVASSIIGQIFLGESPAFIAPVYSLWSPFEIFLYLGLGILSAFTAQFFMATLHFSENVFDKWKFPDWLKPAVGGLALGIIGLYFPQVFGSGLGTIEQALHGNIALHLLVTLIFVKIIATSLSLGSGSSGGVFAPALFVGAVLGGTLGKLFYQNLPFDVAPPGAYALVGMASVFSGAAHAPVTAILIVFEMTGDYRMILPIMVAVVAATSVSQLLNRDSIYTAKLRERGIDVGSLEEAKVLGALLVRDAMSKSFMTVSNKMSAKELLEKMSKEKEKSFFVINSKQDLTGSIRRSEMQSILLEENIEMIIAADIATPIGEYCHPDEPLSEAAKLMLSHNLTQLPVVDPAHPTKIMGILKSEDIFRAYTDLSATRSDLLDRLELEPAQASGMVTIHFVISSRSPIVGKLIRELTLPDKVVLTSIKRRKTVLVPEGDTRIRAKDQVWAVMVPEKEAELRDWLKKYKLKLFL